MTNDRSKNAAVNKSPETIINERYAEKTLILIKPDGLVRGISGEIITEFEKRGLKIVGLKMVVPTERMIEKHYPGKPSQLKAQLIDGMAGKPLIAIVFQGLNAASAAKKIVGATEPKDADPATIRGTFSTEDIGLSNIRNSSLRNVVHASDPEVAAAEVKLWFKKNEIVEYMSMADMARAYEDMLRKDK